MKPNFKKLALLGLTSGLLVSQQVQAESEGLLSTSQDHSCKGQGGCHGKSECKGSGGCGGAKSECKGSGGCGGAKSECKGSGGCGGSDRAGSSDLAENDATDKKDPYADPAQANDQKKDPNEGNMNYHLMTEQELLRELNEDGVKMYNSLNKEGKALALKVASGMCRGSNQCAGLNACKSSTNPCAGKGDCAGKGICSISDKNLAVKLVYDKMNQDKLNQKRQNLTK